MAAPNTPKLSIINFSMEQYKIALDRVINVWILSWPLKQKVDDDKKIYDCTKTKLH